MMCTIIKEERWKCLMLSVMTIPDSCRIAPCDDNFSKSNILPCFADLLKETWFIFSTFAFAQFYYERGPTKFTKY